MNKNSDYILIVSNLLKYEECFLDGLKSVTINENLTLDVSGSVRFTGKQIKSLNDIHFKFNKIKNIHNPTILGLSYCDLITLKGCPEKVDGTLFIDGNPNLKSLQYLPKIILGNLILNENILNKENEFYENNKQVLKNIKLSGYVIDSIKDKKGIINNEGIVKWV